MWVPPLPMQPRCAQFLQIQESHKIIILIEINRSRPTGRLAGLLNVLNKIEPQKPRLDGIPIEQKLPGDGDFAGPGVIPRLGGVTHSRRGGIDLAPGIGIRPRVQPTLHHAHAVRLAHHIRQRTQRVVIVDRLHQYFAQILAPRPAKFVVHEILVKLLPRRNARHVKRNIKIIVTPSRVNLRRR